METPEQIVRREFEEDRTKQEKALLLQRQQAYCAVFPKDEKGDFSVMGEKVLEDLAEFCGANEITYRPGEGERELLIREGRREVWLRIQKHIMLSSDKLWDIYARKRL